MNHTKCYIPDYPRPQFVRKEWTNLNGKWDFLFDKDGTGEDKGYTAGFVSEKKINVPFAYECKSSGIHVHELCKTVWYCKKITVSKAQLTPVVMLNFEGSDYTTTVYVNGHIAGVNVGAYHRFGFDVAKYLEAGDNTIVVKAEDDYLRNRPRGKQRWQDGEYGCWYVQTTGIYKTVWMEYLQERYIASVKMTPDLTDSSVTFDFCPNIPTPGLMAEARISFKGKDVKRVCIELNETDNAVRVDLSAQSVSFVTEYWCPQAPHLYDVEFTLFYKEKAVDRVGSYFGLRDMHVSGDKILLNSVPVYQRLLLDQGYWDESHLTPPDEQAIVKDIELMMQAGFNGARKHQKNEDERFLYYADILGFLVWCEMPSMYWFSDTSIDAFTHEWTRIVTQNYNHPSVVTWVPLNESWGVREIYKNKNQQNFSLAAYYLTKSIDSMRPVISNDGWEHTVSDILTIHNYNQDGKQLLKNYDELIKSGEGWCKNDTKLPYAVGYAYRGQPVIISEFGGAAYARDTKNGWGYGNAVSDDEDFLRRLKSQFDAVRDMPGCSGFCYTQTTDVQQEVNGLFFSDRRAKVDIEKIAKIVKFADVPEQV